MTTVWVCIATYAPHDEAPALCAVAITAQEAEEQIYNVIHERCKVTGGDMEDWIAQDPIERPILPVDTTPKGIEAWKAAGISDGDIDEWLYNKMDEICDCAKDLAHNEAANMTAADFREAFDADLEEAALEGGEYDGDDA